MVLIWYMPLMSWGWVVTQKDLNSLGQGSWKLVSGTSSSSGALDHPQEDFVLSDMIARQLGDKKGRTGQRNSSNTWRPGTTLNLCKKWCAVLCQHGKGDNSSGPQNQFLSSSKQYRHFVDVFCSGRNTGELSWPSTERRKNFEGNKLK